MDVEDATTGEFGFISIGVFRATLSHSTPDFVTFDLETTDGTAIRGVDYDTSVLPNSLAGANAGGYVQMRVFAEHGPPAFISLAAQIGWKPQRRRRARPLREADVAGLLALGAQDDAWVDKEQPWLRR